MALVAFRMNKVRALLTISGVAVGVFVVVAITSVTRGLTESYERDIAAAGPTSFFVYRRPLNAVRACDGSDETCLDRRNPAVTLSEAARIRSLPMIEAVTAHVASQGEFRLRERRISAPFDAYTAGWIAVDGGDIAPGRSFTAAENDNAARVVILNDKLAQALFDDADPIGKAVTLNSVPFQVVGVYHYTSSPFGTPTSGARGDAPKAILPFETARRHLGVWTFGLDLIVKPRPGVTVEDATDAVITQLRTGRKLKPSQENNFAVVTQDRILSVFSQTRGALFMVMVLLASVSLAVGGVGVVAIMMIAVTERTREIGIRKALGATRGIIMWQFLVEAVTLTAVGAAAGVLFGLGATTLLQNNTAVPASTPLPAVIAALVMSAATGIVFGLLPAVRAARLDPVEALRHE
jgi:putative ABC transport system permease protein